MGRPRIQVVVILTAAGLNLSVYQTVEQAVLGIVNQLQVRVMVILTAAVGNAPHGFLRRRR